MSNRRWLKLAILVPIFFTATLFAQDSSAWHDSSPHQAQFVTVDKDVKLEVLDWGGTGRPVVLLSGFGNTAHVFDDFAPKLTPNITSTESRDAASVLQVLLLRDTPLIGLVKMCWQYSMHSSSIALCS